VDLSVFTGSESLLGVCRRFFAQASGDSP
jgi:hypothetical protein